MNEYNVQSSPVQSSNRNVLLVTIYTNYNYGNVLQRCALAKIIESLGFQVTHLFGITTVFSSARNFFKFIVLKYHRIFKFILACFGVKAFRRQFNFADFQSKYASRQILIPIDRVLASSPLRWNVYDYVVTGSDQVWNLALVSTFEALRYYYLDFVDRNKRVNYAPSFGVSSLNALEQPVHIKGLNGFERLSCREEEGCNLIHELTGRDAQLVLDPTLLLTAEQWRGFARKPEYEVPEHYALTYYLAGDDIAAAEKLAGSIPIINALDNTAQVYAMTGPSEFLWLVDHADIVITSSFHGTAFSIIFGKRFVIFKGNWFSRINTLLSNLGLTDRIFELGSATNCCKPIDYHAVNMKLADLREKSMNYLASCLLK